MEPVYLAWGGGSTWGQAPACGCCTYTSRTCSFAVLFLVQPFLLAYWVAWVMDGWHIFGLECFLLSLPII